MKYEIEIRPDIDCPTTHSVGIVTSRGRTYACTWAGTPSRVVVEATWRDERRAFRPFDTTTGRYL